MKIAVVSASQVLQSRTVSVLEEYATGLSFKLDITYYLSQHDLLADVKLIGAFDLYILDVQISQPDGIELARQLRVNGDNGSLLFINGNAARAWEAFRVRADDYLMGALNKTLFKEAMDRIIASRTRYADTKQFEFRLREGVMRNEISKLTYIDKSARVCRYHFADGKVYDGPIVRKSFEEQVEQYRKIDGFYLAGKSLLINLKYIRIINGDLVVLSNGEEIDPPRARIKELYAAWVEYSEQRNEKY